MRLAPSRHLNAVSFWTALQAGLRTGFWQQSGSPAQCSAPQMRPRLSSHAACQHCPSPTAPACTGVQAHFSASCHTSVLRQRLCDCRGRIQHCRADDHTLHPPSCIASPECRTACLPWEAVLHSALSGIHICHMSDEQVAETWWSMHGRRCLLGASQCNVHASGIVQESARPLGICPHTGEDHHISFPSLQHNE